MKNLTQRGFSLLLALALCLSLLTGISFTASAATVDYRYGSTSRDTTGYSNCENIIYNWGNRGTLATFLSPNAEAFYEDNNTSYSALSALSGSSIDENIPDSALFQTLRTLMASNHSYVNSYDACRDMFAFTDCQNSALTSTKISSFYSGAQIGPAWDSGSTWNREHTWPNSKGDANGSGENDIMMLRPTASSDNSSRGDTAYGESSGYFHPNSKAGGSYDLRGDVARIVLYVYVRWQDTSSSNAVSFGTDGVIESKEILLKWLEEDPVDTWELGRNDSVESITGTRNVFIDYPELGFLLFGESVPSNLQSPSNSVDSGTTETVTVRFIEMGQQTLSYTIPAGQYVQMPAGSLTPPDGYSFAGWVQEPLEETSTQPSTVLVTGNNIKASEITYHALYTRLDADGTDSGSIFMLHSGTITEGDYLVVSNGGAMSTNQNANPARRDVVSVTINNNTISNPSSDLIWHIAPNGTNYTLYNEAVGQYLAATGAKSKLGLSGSVTDYVKWSVSGSDQYVFENVGNKNKNVNYTLRRNADYGFACYAASTGTGITLYKAVTGTTYYTTLTLQAEPVAAVGGVEYTSFTEAYAACGENQYVKLLADLEVNMQLTKDLYIDLNGYILEGTLDVGACRIYGMDSTTNTYSTSTGYMDCYDTDGNPVEAVQTHFKTDAAMTGDVYRYMAIQSTNGWTFHRYYVGITAISLNIATTGIGYKATFCGTAEVVAQLADSQVFGYTLSLEGGNTVNRYLDTITSGQVVTLRVNNFDIANYSQITLTAKVSVKLGDTVIESAEHSITMHQLVETVNANYTAYPDKLEALAAFVEKHYDTMRFWQVENLYKPE